MTATLKDLKKMKNKYKVSFSGTKKNIAKGLIIVSGSRIDKKDLISILPLLDGKEKKSAEKSLKIFDEDITEFKGMWKPKPYKPIAKMSREELIEEIKSFRDAWQKITTRDMDRSDKRLNEETMAFLRADVRWHYSNQTKRLAMHWLSQSK